MLRCVCFFQCRNLSVASRHNTHHSAIVDQHIQSIPHSVDGVPAACAADLLRRVPSTGSSDQGPADGDDRTERTRDPGVVPEQTL